MSNSKDGFSNYSFQFNNSIKVFISLYKFRQELIDNEKSISTKEVILLNKNWFTAYKNFYDFDKILYLITSYNLTDLDLTEQNIIFNNLFNDFYKQNSQRNLLLFYDEEFPNNILYNDDIRIKFVNDFEIINEDVYQNLLNCMGIFKYLNNNAKKYEFKIVEKKIIIKYTNENCLNLLIGKIGDKTDIYVPDILVNFPGIQLLVDEYNNFENFYQEKLNDFLKGDTNIIKNIEQQSLSERPYENNVKFFIYLHDKYPQLDNKNEDNNPKTSKIEREKIVRAFMYYYLNIQKLISNNKEKNIKNINKESECFLINKSWMNAFKSLIPSEKLKILLNKIIYSCYSSFIDSNGYNGLLENDKIISNIYQKISENNEFSNEINYLDEKALIDNLNIINPFLIEYDYDDKAKKENLFYLKKFENFEIIPMEKYNFIKALFPLKYSSFINYKYFINDENYFSFLTKYQGDKILNIYHINKKNDEPTFNIECIIKGNNFEKFFNNMKNNTLKTYILSLNFDGKLVAKLDDMDGIVYLFKDGELYKLLQKKFIIKEILISLVEFCENINSNLNISDKKDYNPEIIYLVHKEFVTKYLEKYNLNYAIINEAILNIKKDKNDKTPELELKIKLLNEYINKNFRIVDEKNVMINNNENSTLINLKNNNNKELPHIIINNNDEKIYYYDDYFLLNEKIISLLKINLESFPKLKFFVKENYIFLFQDSDKGNSIIEIGKLGKENTFKLEILIDSTKNSNSILTNLKKKTYLQFYQSCFSCKNEENGFQNFSPFFDQDNNIIGNAYKPNEQLNNFSNSYYSQMFINVIYLIIYFKFYQYEDKKSNPKKYYYLINEEWMKNFKKNNRYEKTKEDLETDKNRNISVIVNKQQKNKNLLKKLIYVVIGEMYELNKEYNDINFFLDEFPSEPECEYRKDFLSGGDLFFYKNYFILDEEIHSRIFNLNNQQSEEMKKKNNYCQCFFEDGYAFIILNEFITRLNKIVIEVGNFTEEKKFNLIYLFIFNSTNDYTSNFQKMKESGINKYLASLNFNDQNIFTLNGYNSMSGNGGYIFKYSKNSNINNIINEGNNINNLNNSINPNIFDFNHNIIPPGPFNPPNLKDIFPLPPMIGLQNVGATCYMNATIQCFGQIEKFTQYFKYYPNLKDLIKKYKGRENKDSLSESFKELIENLWPNENSNLINKTYVGKNSNNSYYKPYEFKKKISKMNPLFQGVQANDSKDLVNFIIMQLHEELNMGSKCDINQDANQTDELAVYNNFRYGYYYENKSIICDLFYGINGTLYECSSCRTRKYNFQIGFFYIFPLEEVRKFKIQQNQQMFENNLKIQFANNMLNWNNMQFMQQSFNIQNQNINSVNIIDCFNYNQRQEFMQGENAMFCNTCNRTENAAFQNYICDCPEIMIIILNRGQGIQFKIKLEFTEFLDIGSYVRNNNNNPCNYKLIGVVTHMGESGASGHFVAFCRSPVDDQWYNYNDDLCFPVNNFKNDVIDYAMPYILFYQKI